MTYHLKSCSDLASNFNRYLPAMPNWRQMVIPPLKAFDRNPLLMTSSIFFSLIALTSTASTFETEKDFSPRYFPSYSEIEEVIKPCIPEQICAEILYIIFGNRAVPSSYFEECVHNMKDRLPESC